MGCRRACSGTARCAAAWGAIRLKRQYCTPAAFNESVCVPQVDNTHAASFTPPLLLILRANALHSWRRLKGLRDQSRLLTLVIALFMVGYLLLAFWLFLNGLTFVAKFPGFGTALLERLLYLMFALLFVLLILSNLVISYTNFFRNRETAALMTLPVTAQTIFRWKLIESTVLASWAFLFLIAPFVVAFGMTRNVQWHFYPVTVLMLALFIVLPSVMGACMALVLARHMDRRAFQIGAVAIVLGLIAAVAIWLKPDRSWDDGSDTPLGRMLLRTQLAQFALLPSYWMSSTVLHWTDGSVRAAGFFMLVLLSNVLFFAALAANVTGSFFYSAASAVQSRGSVFRRWRWFQTWQLKQRQGDGHPGRIEKLLRLVPWLPSDVRALVAKDFRMFWRDTTQWGQSLMLFGLLGVYILNLRHFAQQLSSPFWINLVSYLNLAACSLNLATITTRFVYPQFSLEGKRLWIVGMAPLGLARVVRTKYVMAVVLSLTVTLGLIWLSCHMLMMDVGRTLYFTGAVAVMSFTLNGLAVGLGVLYPNLKEENPGKIVSGFGGTFCLVLSFVYILGSVVLLGFGAPWANFASGELMLRSVLFLTTFLVLSFALGWVPLQVAFARVRTFEV